LVGPLKGSALTPNSLIPPTTNTITTEQLL